MTTLQIPPPQIKPKTQQLRFRFYRELEALYRHLCDEIAESDLSERDMSDLILTLMRSRQACLSQLVSVEELNTDLAIDLSGG
ncbi:MAG: hypothetical protein KME17_20310 [Cyanosarcina radialis HA8281-LM2]|nr:hypothetical protein [Cyanosarcina radialis HA8281-LM2]